ncbi:hypothetical protein LCGC14_2033000, partial [marine sediment metagenome]
MSTNEGDSPFALLPSFLPSSGEQETVEP